MYIKRILTWRGVVGVVACSQCLYKLEHRGIITKAKEGDCEEHKAPAHSLNIVGYDVSRKGIPYWIVRNSWGTDWSEKGYARIELGKNVTGIELSITYVTLERYPI